MARPSSAFLSFWIALLLASVLYLPGLGDRAFLDYDESGYAAIAQDTFQSQDSLTPRIGEHLWFEKPPLYFWLSGIANEVMPVPEFASRVPAALAGIACVLLVWLVLFSLANDAGIALFGSGLLATTGAFIDISRQGRVDTLVMAFSLLLTYGWIRARNEPRWYLLAGIALGLGIMTKSIVAFFVLPALLLWLALEKGARGFRNAWLWWGALAAFLVALPWHLYETLRYGTSFWQEYLFHNVLARFNSDVLGASGTNADYAHYLGYYAPLLCGLFVFAFLLFLLRGRRMEHAERHTALVFAFGSVLVLAVFFSAHTKVVYYLPFVFPYLAITIALVAHHALRVSVRVKQCMLGLLVLLSLALGAHSYIYADPNLSYERAIAEEERIVGTMVRSYPGPVYFTAPAYWETIRYYSGEKPLESWNPSNPRPALVVVHRYFGNPVASVSKSVLYEGTEVSLYQVP